LAGAPVEILEVRAKRRWNVAVLLDPGVGLLARAAPAGMAF